MTALIDKLMANSRAVVVVCYVLLAVVAASALACGHTACAHLG